MHIQLTTQQARSIAGVSSEAWRHWRKQLPHLSSKKGKAARFTMGEIVVLCAVEKIVSTLGVRVAIISDSLDHLFQISAPMSLHYLQECLFLVTVEEGKVVKTSQLQKIASPALVIPCNSFVEQVLRNAFEYPDALLQKNLPFPPATIASGTA